MASADGSSQRGFSTRSVHSGRLSGEGYRSPAPAIYPATGFVQEDIGALDDVLGGLEPGFAYTRHGNPTTRELELAVASLENTEEAIAFGSGMAALHAALLSVVKSGSNVVAAIDIYGATLHLLETIFGSLGVHTHVVDATDLDALEKIVAEVKPKAILCETLSNPSSSCR